MTAAGKILERLQSAGASMRLQYVKVCLVCGARFALDEVHSDFDCCDFPPDFALPLAEPDSPAQAP